MDTIYFRKVLTVVSILVLTALSFLVLRPILLYIIFGFILTFIFNPIYKILYKFTKSPNLSATIVSLILILIIILPFWFFTPILIEQSIKLYLVAQQTDFVEVLKSIFPSFFASEQFSGEIGSILHSFTTNIANSITNSLAKLILNFPTLMLNSIVVLFTFFFALRDKDKLFGYLKSLSPFTKEVEKKLAKSTRDITASILFGQIVLGFLQGVVMSIGFFIFQVPNAVLLSVLATIAGILPIIGPMIVWLPVMAYLIIIENNFAAVGILIFGIASSNIDNLLRPIFVSKMTSLHSVIALIGMIGGLFLFGLIGLVLGPLILAYLIIILEVYQGKDMETPSPNQT